MIVTAMNGELIMAHMRASGPTNAIISGVKVRQIIHCSMSLMGMLGSVGMGGTCGSDVPPTPVALAWSPCGSMSLPALGIR